MPERSACDGVKWNLALENVFHSSALKVYLHKYVRVCEIEAVVKQSWRTGESGERSPWSICKLLLIENSKDTRRMHNHWLGKQPSGPRPVSMQYSMSLLYNTLIIWLYSVPEKRGIFLEPTWCFSQPGDRPRQHWGPVACWRQTPLRKGGPNGQHSSPCWPLLRPAINRGPLGAALLLAAGAAYALLEEVTLHFNEKNLNTGFRIKYSCSFPEQMSKLLQRDSWNHCELTKKTFIW